jgi:hypothetical protein
MVTSARPLVTQWLRELSDEAKVNQNLAADKKRKRAAPFEPGTMVWLISHVRGGEGEKPKLSREFRGPYVVVNMIHDTTVRLRPIGSSEALVVAHIDHVKAYRAADKAPVVLDVSDKMDDRTNGQDDDEGEEWEVEAVEDHRFQKGCLQFFIKWKNSDQMTWEDEEGMNCAARVEEYFQRRCTHA